MASPVVLIDGSSYLFRAFHAIPLLTNSKGIHTNAVKGVINMIKRLQKDFPESQLVVVFDAKGKTFRNDMYSEYKANRPPMPEELREQIEPIHKIIKAMGLPLLVIEGVEADDVIGTLAAEATRQQHDVVVSTGDKDMAQLVSPHVSLINTMTDVHLDEAGVLEKFGVAPEFIIDYLALMGDKVDNIPGVPKVGEKTAVGLVAGLGSLETIYNNLDEVASLGFRGAKTLAPRLVEHKDQAFLSKQLATIKCDVELPQSLLQLKSSERDEAELLTLFRDLEFKGWIAELSKDESVVTAANAKVESNKPVASGSEDASDSNELAAEPELYQGPVDYQTITDESQLQTWIAGINQADRVAIRVETTAAGYMDAELVGLAISIELGAAVYIPMAHEAAESSQQLTRDLVLDALKPHLESNRLVKIGHDLKQLMHLLAKYDIRLLGPQQDIQLASYVLNSVASKHDLNSLTLKYLGESSISYEDIAGKGVKQLSFEQLEIAKAAEYAAQAVDMTLRLQGYFSAMLQQTDDLNTVYSKIEIPAQRVLWQMEQQGALIDSDLLLQQSHDLEQRLQQLERQSHDIAGQVFNLGSPKQLGDILFNQLELPVIKKTPKGAPSTAEEVLQELAQQGYELPQLLMEHRGLAKLKSTYTDKLPLMVNSRTQRIHTSYHQAVAATGRLSSSDPNLQNIPIRSDEGRKIRQAFIVPAGYRLVAADYSQIELRIMAHLSDDPGLLKAFADDRDVHRATAAEVFQVAEAEVSDNQRRSAKAINFGLIYGMSAFGLAKQIGVGRGEAQEYVNRYFERYPGVKEYMERTREQAKEQGYIETLFGRRLYLPEIRSRNVPRRQHAERTAINAPMQGTAADIIKKAMIRVQDWLPGSGFDAQLLMQVHDELIVQVREDQAQALALELTTQMQCAAALKVPLVVDAGIGQHWHDAH